jgi:hypothetical protein
MLNRNWRMQMNRNWRSWLAATLATFFAIAACSQDEQGSEQHAKEAALSTASDTAPMAGASAAKLSDAELKENSAAGLDGSADAAFLVYNHYQMAALDARKAEFWAQIAAENGSILGMVEYARYLLDVPDDLNCRRAQFWANRATAFARSDSDRSTAKSIVVNVSKRCENRKGDQR